MANWPFTQGIHDIGNGLYGYVQPDGTWGWSNAGLIASDSETLLVDTLMSVPLTREMLDQFRAKVPEAAKIDRLVNTHANPDHFFGNGLVADAEIIGTTEARKEMTGFNPKMLANLKDVYTEMGDTGAFLYETMGRKFDFSGVDELTLPNRTFDGRLDLTVGSKAVSLIDLGPAHTDSDTIVWVPQDRVVFTGDLLFNEGHPIMWAGPVENWIAACQYIVDLDPQVVVPGHGPITDTQAVRNIKAYFEYVRDESRKRFEAGLSYEDAARDINMQEFRGWSDPERIVANVFSLYKQWGAQFTPEQHRDLFGAMGRYHHEMQSHAEGCDHAH
ncbi:glyoxylase-like metal-dependent hydrolase (beta-lactamase superfamily II) [Sphingobium sp. B2D3A]|uniref:MBL fold metallo-hydrolase n=1 Tax=unclassified Sphingobium TaxID=2611147 RepID=UPI002224F368|nr:MULTISPECIES: MBL fold metallo-hydrolase [unclassified Sphingobium]MCW2339101.1 glyoxylase-like metal-dependent hydrolase (beta-lactamase superfamily II) [Sphingobium sp. B2D3A]MCW2385526.1 glyoxylase-like metal-dependent hydrolase (beta-lactamase superfamily II) [Sphingobium sp. B2D3D]